MERRHIDSGVAAWLLPPLNLHLRCSLVLVGAAFTGSALSAWPAQQEPQQQGVWRPLSFLEGESWAKPSSPHCGLLLCAGSVCSTCGSRWQGRRAAIGALSRLSPGGRVRQRSACCSWGLHILGAGGGLAPAPGLRRVGEAVSWVCVWEERSCPLGRLRRWQGSS